jgi:DNA replication and repair protein RecF
VNEVLVKIGGQLFRYRLRLLRGLRELLPGRHASITASEDAVSIDYLPSFLDGTALTDEQIALYEEDRDAVEQVLYSAIERRSMEESARKTSLVGPHRDKPAFTLNGRSALDFASQGQQRSIAIAYKLSELQLIEQITHSKPILLLDDVMSELDATRRATLAQYVNEAAQTFITTTNLDYFTPELLERAQVIKLPLG